MRTFFPGCFVAVALASIPLHGQSSGPTLSAPIPAQVLAPGGAAITIDVRNHFTVPGVTGSIAQIDTVMGKIDIELLASDAPRTVANFLNYVSSGRYRNTFIHRAVTNFVIQGGGYTATVPYVHIPTFPPVQNEFKLPNLRGYLSMAKQDGNPNSATSEWFVNLGDNRANLDNQNGGFTVFARVIGSGMNVVDAIAALPRARIGLENATDPASTPVRNVPAGETQLRAEYYVAVADVRSVTLFPTGGGPSVLSVTAQASSPNVVDVVVSGSTITMSPTGPGTTSVTVRVTDTHGNAATSTYGVSVSATAPSFTAQPASQTVAAGSTVVFNAPATGAASYRWERDGVVIPGANSGTLVINNATAADEGRYVNFAANAFAPNGVPSATATLRVRTDVPPTSVGRLVNLSILNLAGSGSRILTMGAVVGRGDLTIPLPLVIRAVGPSLQGPPFNVPGVLPDPVMTFFRQGDPTPIDSNDNWGGSAALIAAFRAVAAFDLSSNLDSALVRTPGVTPGGYTVQVTGKQDASGQVIAEIYEGAGERTAVTPRLINLSTLTEIDPGTELAMGFVIGGQTARTMLIRGVGPSLVAFDVAGFMADPRLELYNNSTGARIAVNDDWNANLEISSTAASIAAFAMVGPLSKDAALLITLPPGEYSARVSGVNNTGGSAIVEVYEVP